ncbi:MAG: hypothetical protein RL412_1561 [Pseudomonadota bacterium]
MTRELQVDYATVQFVVTAYLLGLGLFQPIQGLLADRFGRRPVLLGGYSLFLLASLLAGAASQLWTLVAARFLQAMGISVATVVTRAIVRDSFEPGPAASALSFITAVMGLAPVVAPIVGGFAAETLGWRGIFLIHAIVTTTLLLVMVWKLKETRPIDTASMTLTELVQSAVVLLRDRAFVGHSLTYSSVSAAGFIFITVGAALYEKLYGFSSADFGALWSGLAISYVAGAAAAGHLTRRIGSKRASNVGMAFNVSATVLFTITAFSDTPNLIWLSGSLALLMIANGILSPLALSGAVDDHPQLAGVAAGLSSSIAMLLSMLSAGLTGWLYDGTARYCAVLMAVAALVCWCSARIAQRSP